ncbi:MAG: HAD family hydrolase [Alphaproteobacteria bacterium]|nr:HAD family hydrolase [Alphaproteobacteria bacterium]MDA7983466.1 HAD family hydrolase [Alphaproteobacteria bacterium]MDA7989124.1 HAD family hydrolase [Alphaproteobacteria bacterium]MDA8008713.1 HAD family hydrolase [Alphaproteobacteria bacterium]
MSDYGHIRGVLFDKDGTLMDYERSWGVVNREAARVVSRGDAGLERRLLEAGGVDLSCDVTRMDSAFASGSTLDVARAFMAAGLEADESALVDELNGLFSGVLETAVAVTDLREFFGELRGLGLCLGVASNDSAAGVASFLEKFGVSGLVDFAIGYDSGYGQKPGVGMLRGFCGAVGLDAGEVAMVGDTFHDMEMGRVGGVGLRVGVLTGTGTADELGEISDICLSDVSELTKILRN